MIHRELHLQEKRLRVGRPVDLAAVRRAREDLRARPAMTGHPNRPDPKETAVEYAENRQWDGPEAALYDKTPGMPSPRVEHVKQLDDALSRLEHRIDQLSQRIAPALRSWDQVKGEVVDKLPSPNESDVVAHLRHTHLRVNRSVDALSELLDRIDL